MYHPKKLTPEEIEAKKQYDQNRKKRIRLRAIENAKRQARREGRTVNRTEASAMKRTLKASRKKAELVKEYDKAKLSDWQAFLCAFDILWEGSAYLPQSESRVLNELQKVIEVARTVFRDLERETMLTGVTNSHTGPGAELPRPSVAAPE